MTVPARWIRAGIGCSVGGGEWAIRKRSTWPWSKWAWPRVDMARGKTGLRTQMTLRISQGDMSAAAMRAKATIGLIQWRRLRVMRARNVVAMMRAMTAIGTA